MSSRTAIPPLMPGSQALQTLSVDKAKIKTLMGEVLSTLNTWKSSVRAATTSDETLTGTATIDGVILVEGDSVLVKDQTDSVENGIYVVNSSTWQRRNDMPAGVLAAGVAVYVNEGTANAEYVFVCTNDKGDDVVNTSELVFSSLSSAPLGKGIINQIQVSDGAGGVAASTVTATVAGALVAPTGLTATAGGVTATAGNIVATAGSVSAGTTVTAGTGLTATTGNLTLSAAGGKLAISAASNGSVGTATLNSGGTTVVVATTAVTTNSLVFVTPTSTLSSAAFFFVNTIVNGTSFTINVDVDPTTNVTFNWMIVN